MRAAMGLGWGGAYWVNFQVVGLPSASTIFSKAAPTRPQARAKRKQGKGWRVEDPQRPVERAGVISGVFAGYQRWCCRR